MVGLEDGAFCVDGARDVVGSEDGADEGVSLGVADGASEGVFEGVSLGKTDGASDGMFEGCLHHVRFNQKAYIGVMKKKGKGQYRDA